MTESQWIPQVLSMRGVFFLQERRLIPLFGRHGIQMG